MELVLTPELVLEAYKQGLFPMAYHAGSPYIHWICPEMRGQLSIPELHIPRSLKKTINKAPFDIRINTAFTDVLLSCAQTTETRPETWINEPIIKVFGKLHAQGHAHSVEAWQDNELVGGVYGLSIGRAFFGESMFSRATNASKVALVHLTARLWKGGYTILDTQFTNPHLEQFGIYEIAHKDYKTRLKDAISGEADFNLQGLNECAIIKAYFEMHKDTQP